MNEFENVVTLTDEDGVEVDFEILDVVPYEGGEYAVLLPVDDESDVVDAVILEVLASGEIGVGLRQRRACGSKELQQRLLSQNGPVHSHPSIVRAGSRRRKPLPGQQRPDEQKQYDDKTKTTPGNARAACSSRNGGKASGTSRKSVSIFVHGRNSSVERSDAVCIDASPIGRQTHFSLIVA